MAKSRRHKSPSRAAKQERRRENDIRSRKATRFDALTDRRENQDEISAFLANRQVNQEAAEKARDMGR